MRTGTGRRAFSRRSLILATASLAAAGGGSCSDGSIQGVETDRSEVSSVVPEQAPRGRTLDLHVHGSGFDEMSVVSLERNGVAVAEIRTNETRFVSPEELVAEVTISLDAGAGLYDLVVASRTRKRGLALEAFRVTVIGVGTLPGGVSSVAYDVNGNEEVVGSVQIGFPGEEGFDDFHATYWRAGALEDLGPGTAFAISDECAPGECRVVGTRGGAAVIWRKAGGAWSYEALPLPGDGLGAAWAVGPRGDRIVGNVASEQGGVAVVWSESPGEGWSVTSLAPSADDANAYGVNDAGIVVGRAAGDAIAWTSEGGEWRAHVLAPLPGDVEALARSVNAHGDVVGESGPLGGPRNRAALWRRTGTGWGPPIELFPPDPGGPAIESSMASDINDAGEIVGTIVYGDQDVVTRLRGLAQQRAFLWTEALGLVDLGLLQDRGTLAFALNEQDVIVGTNSELALLWRITSTD